MLECHLDQAQLLVIGADHVLLSYRAAYRRVSGVREVMFISSLWQQNDGQWRNSFSQDTPATPPETD